MKILILAIAFLMSFQVMAERTHEAEWIVIDCGEDTDLSAAQGLSDFSDFSAAEVEQAQRALMQAEGADVRWRVDRDWETHEKGYR